MTSSYPSSLKAIINDLRTKDELDEVKWQKLEKEIETDNIILWAITLLSTHQIILFSLDSLYISVVDVALALVLGWWALNIHRREKQHWKSQERYLSEKKRFAEMYVIPVFLVLYAIMFIAVGAEGFFGRMSLDEIVEIGTCILFLWSIILYSRSKELYRKVLINSCDDFALSHDPSAQTFVSDRVVKVGGSIMHALIFASKPLLKLIKYAESRGRAGSRVG